MMAGMARWGLGLATVFVLATVVHAQGPLRRIGERVRENREARQTQRAAPPTQTGVRPLAPAADRAPLTARDKAPPMSARDKVVPLTEKAVPLIARDKPSPKVPPATVARAYSPPSVNPQTSQPNSIAAPPRIDNPLNNPSSYSQASAVSPLMQPPVVRPVPVEPDPVVEREPMISVERRAVAPQARGAKLGLIVDQIPPREVAGRLPRSVRGALVVGTEPNSSAALGGFKAGDRIVAVDGRLVEDVTDLQFRISNFKQDDRVEIKYVRDEKIAVKTLVFPDSNGRFDDSAKAILLAQKGESIVAEASEDAPPSSVPYSVEGLGRTLGSWLGGKAKDVDNSSNLPQSNSNETAEPKLRDIDQSPVGDNTEELPAPATP